MATRTKRPKPERCPAWHVEIDERGRFVRRHRCDLDAKHGTLHRSRRGRTFVGSIDGHGYVQAEREIVVEYLRTVAQRLSGDEARVLQHAADDIAAGKHQRAFL